MNRPPYNDDSAFATAGLFGGEPGDLSVDEPRPSNQGGHRPLITHDDSADVVRYASHLVPNRQDPGQVTAAAEVLFAWLEESTDANDVCARLAALFQQHSNDCWARGQEDVVMPKPYGPAEFLANAQVLYVTIGGAR